MVDIVSRLRLLSREARLIHVVRSEELTVSLTGAPQEDTPLFFNRKVDATQFHPAQLVILRDRRAWGRVTTVEPERMRLRLVVEGTDADSLELLDPPVNLPGYTGSIWELTEDDTASIRLAVRMGVELVAVSFLDDPGNAARVMATITEAARETSSAELPLMVVKVESPRGITRLGEVLDAMARYEGGVAVEVARGDLANELSLTHLGEAQERCVCTCRTRDIPLGVATGLLGSMRLSPHPTRAEVVDAWYAVRGGTDFLLLADETANEARYPDEAIRMLADVVRRAQEFRAPPPAVGSVDTKQTFECIPHDRTLFCLAGVPAVGKSTIRQALCDHYPADVVFLRRWTTRPMRPGEEGEIVQLSRTEFCEKVARRHLTAVFCSNQTMYGVSVEELEELLRTDRRWIGVISASAGLALRDRGYHVIVIYLTVRNRDALVERLRKRGHTAEEITMRMHEYDDADAEWREASATHILYTDELTVEETVAAVARHLRLPLPAASHTKHANIVA
jgi:guanylate kinase